MLAVQLNGWGESWNKANRLGRDFRPFCFNVRAVYPVSFLPFLGTEDLSAL